MWRSATGHRSNIARKWHGVKNANIFLAMVVQHGGTPALWLQHDAARKQQD